MSAYYVAAFTDSGCLQACNHQHVTVTAAVACVSTAGGFVLAMENDAPRALSDTEENEFQCAMYGKGSAGVDAASPQVALRWPKVLVQS